MKGSGEALIRQYGEEMRANVEENIDDLLFRFGNKALKDTVARVGGDPGAQTAPQRPAGGRGAVLHRAGRRSRAHRRGHPRGAEVRPRRRRPPRRNCKRRSKSRASTTCWSTTWGSSRTSAVQDDQGLRTTGRAPRQVSGARFAFRGPERRDRHVSTHAQKARRPSIAPPAWRYWSAAPPACWRWQATGGWPYAVPLSYAFDGEKLYFHCAPRGPQAGRHPPRGKGLVLRRRRATM